MSNTGHLANIAVGALIAAVESGVSLMPVTADSALAAKIAPFIKQFPGWLASVGIAEQNTVSTAAGLAPGGKVAVTCNIAPFLISWANEQIEVDICCNNASAKLFDLNAGASCSPLASTHHAIDDPAVMHGSGSIQIFILSTPRECRQIINCVLAYQDPVYVRLDGKALPEPPDESYRFVPDAVLTLREGEDVALVATGSMVHEVVEATQQLANLSIQAKMVSVPSIHPCDTTALPTALRPYSSVIIVEEHNVNGGSGSLVTEVLARAGVGITLQRSEIPDGEYTVTTDRDWMHQYHGSDATTIAALI